MTAMETNDNSVLTLWELAFLITMLILLLSFLFQAKGAVAGLLQKQPGAETTDLSNLMVQKLHQQIQSLKCENEKAKKDCEELSRENQRLQQKMDQIANQLSVAELSVAELSVAELSVANKVSIERDKSKDDSFCSKYKAVHVAKHGHCWHLDRDCQYVRNSGHVCSLNPCTKCVR